MTTFSPHPPPPCWVPTGAAAIVWHVPAYLDALTHRGMNRPGRQGAAE